MSDNKHNVNFGLLIVYNHNSIELAKMIIKMLDYGIREAEGGGSTGLRILGPIA